ncbi:hypothetical protein Tco_1311238 [Tanacetum coccineum]
MAISVISISLDSSKDSVGTPAGRVILFGTIPTTIPDTTPSVIPPTTHINTTPIPTVSPTISSSPDYTPASPDYSPSSDREFDPSEDPSPTTSGALRRRVMVLAPGQPIPYGRPYRYHLNGPIHMMTARKRVGPMPTHRYAVRHSVDYSSSDDSSLSSSSSSSSGTSSDSSADALSDSASSRSSSDHSSITIGPSHDSSSANLSRKRSRSSVASVPSPDTATDLEGCSKDSFEPYVPREAELGVDFEDESFEPSRDRGIDARVVVEAIDREEIETGMRGPVEVRVDRVTHLVVADDIPESAQEGAVIESVQRDQGYMIVATGQQSADKLERIGEL